MQAIDVNQLFARAEQAFVAGRLDAARDDLLAVLRAAGDHPVVLHLLALVEKKSGNFETARDAFERAAALAPNDPQIANNHANLLKDLGEEEAALRRYDAALAAAPGFRDARYNRALLLQALGRREEALAELEALRAERAEARIESARGSVLRDLGRWEEAAQAYDSALALEPQRIVALHGRARIAMERGEEGASALYRRAFAARPDDRELLLGLAESLEAEGDPEGLRLLRDAAARQPDWIEGLESLARMRSEEGEAAGFADHYLPALAQRPFDRDLHRSYWRVLASGDLHAEAVAAIREAAARLEPDPATRLMEAVYASEAGDPDGALALLDGFPGDRDGYDYRFARGRVALRAGDGGQAATHLERAVALDPASIAAWANLDLAWRLAGDERHHWLSGQPGLYGAADIGLSAAELGDLAALLRRIHKARAHPIGQSLRGGTQTRGRLFARREPEIARLRDALEEAVRAHFRGLPPRDDAHPLLRHRDAPVKLAGSWSVRLTGQGFHVHHIHPEGILSSACYVALPASLGGEETRDGWLELGRPPRELPLPLEPLASIEPKVGRLALFPSYLYHGTRPFSDGERLTVAFDVEPA